VRIFFGAIATTYEYGGISDSEKDASGKKDEVQEEDITDQGFSITIQNNINLPV